MLLSIYVTILCSVERFQAVTKPAAYRARQFGDMCSRLTKYICGILIFSVAFCTVKFFDLKVGKNIDCSNTHPTESKALEVISVLLEIHNVTRNNAAHTNTTAKATKLIDEICKTEYFLLPTELRINRVLF